MAYCAFWLRLLLSLFWIPLCFLYGLVLCALKPGNVRVNATVAHLFGRMIMRINGFHLSIDGAEILESSQRSNKPYIYISNHQYVFDIPIFASIFPERTVGIGKKSLKWIPFFGLFFWAAGNILIDRRKHVSALKKLSAVTDVMKKKNVCIFIFPEGTRGGARVELLPFKKGAFHMAIEAQCPIVPIVCQPYGHLWNWKERHLQSGTIKLKVLPPEETAGLSDSDVEVFTKKIKDRMQIAIGGLSLIAYCLLLPSCSTFGDRSTHLIRQLVPYNLHVRRPESAGANPNAGPGGPDYYSEQLPNERFDCDSFDELFKTVSLTELRKCLGEDQARVTVKYLLVRDVTPELVLQELQNAPACLAALAERIPVPREIVFQSVERDVLNCYTSRIDIDADEFLFRKIPFKNRFEVTFSFPLREPPETDEEMRMLLFSWMMTPFWSGNPPVIPSKLLSDYLCTKCMGKKNKLEYIDPKQKAEQADATKLWPN